MAFWNPVTCFAGCALVYSIGEFLSKKTKGAVSSLLFACVLFLAGFWSGIFPPDITTQPGLVDMMSKFGIALLITNLGSLISLEDMCKEWKSVVLSLTAIGGIALGCFTVGSWLFGREYALIAAPPIAGSTVAGILVTSAAEAANRPELAAFAVLILAVQKFFGIPISTLCIRKELKNKMKNGDFSQSAAVGKEWKLPSMRLFPEPKKGSSAIVYLCKLAIVATIANWAGLATLIPGEGPANYILNPNIACLIFGLIFTRIGFLEKGILDKAQSNGITLFGLMLMLPGSLAKVTPVGLLEMLIPTFGMLAVGAVFIALACIVVGKLLGYSPYMSTAIGVTSMLAYPATQIISNECTDAMEGTPEEKARASEFVLPKMIVGGFVTVTIASVAFASIICPIIFK